MAQKLTDRSALALPISTDIVHVVDDPGGTPTSHKVTLADLSKGLVGANIPGSISAAAAIADDSLVRGDGGASGLQDSALTINDVGDIIPDVDATQDLGSTANTFKDFHFTGEDGEYATARRLLLLHKDYSEEAAILPYTIGSAVTGGVWTITLTATSPSGDLRFVLGGKALLAPASTLTVNATAAAGTDASPKTVYVYVQNNGSDVPELVASNVNPAGVVTHAHCANYKAGAVGASAVNIYGKAESIVEMYKMATNVYHRFFAQGALYQSGLDVTATTSDVTIATGDYELIFEMITTAQKQVSADGLFYIKNDGTYNESTDFSFGGEYSDGVAIADGKSFNVVLGVMEDDTTRIMALVQTGTTEQYGDFNKAFEDKKNQAVYQPSDSFLKSIFVPVARIVVDRSGATYSLEQFDDGNYYQDLRGTVGAGGGSSPAVGAPAGSTYILQTADASLPNSQDIDSLTDGLLKHTNGVFAQAVANTDYLTPALASSLADGSTATTQTAADNSTKVATTAYVDAAAGGSAVAAMTLDVTLGEDVSSGDWLYLKPADGKFWKTDATAAASTYKPVRATEAGSADGTISATFDGIVNISGIVESSTYYLQDEAIGSIFTTGTISAGGVPIGRSTNNVEKAGQTIEESSAFTVIGIEVYLQKSGSPTDNTIIRIETDNAGVPSGTLVDAAAAFTIDSSSLTTSLAKHTLPFGKTITFASSTKYWVVVSRDGSLADADYAIIGKTTTDYANGKYYKYESSWLQSSGDLFIDFYDNVGAGTIGTSPGTETKKVGTGFEDDKLYVANYWTGIQPESTDLLYANSGSLSYTIPGGTLGTSGGIRGRLFVTGHSTVASNPITIVLGGTTIGTADISLGNKTGDFFQGIIEFEIVANSSESSQLYGLNVHMASSVTTDDDGAERTSSGSSSKDSSGDLTLAIGLSSVTVGLCTVEKL